MITVDVILIVCNAEQYCFFFPMACLSLLSITGWLLCHFPKLLPHKVGGDKLSTFVSSFM